MQNSIAIDRSQGRGVSASVMMESQASKMSFLSRPRTQHMMRIQSEGMIPQRNMQVRKVLNARRLRRRLPNL